MSFIHEGGKLCRIIKFNGKKCEIHQHILFLTEGKGRHAEQNNLHKPGIFININR